MSVRLGDELRARVYEAWELRGTPYLPDAVAAIVEWRERLALTVYERRQERAGRLVRLLRETDPERVPRRRAA